ncbi:hypothetical protein LP316_15175 [Thalassotalea sp. LPB0316]|nr:hypothetical protein LP316_15175 [Thalassotalea sp. LPB0316]
MANIFKLSSSRLSSSITKLVLGLTLSLTLIYSCLLLAYSWLIEDNVFNRLVDEQVKLVKQQYQSTGKVALPHSQMFQLHRGSAELPEEISLALIEEPERVEFTISSGKTFHLARFNIEKEEYILLADVGSIEVSPDYFQYVVRWLIALSFFSCLIVALVAWRMGRRISQPIEQLASAVKTVNSDNLYQLNEVVQQMPNNELGTLAKSIELSFTMLNQALAREVHFTKDISHEIRTPISILQNALSKKQLNSEAELKLNDRQDYAIGFSPLSVKQMETATEALSQTTHVLLALARNESSSAKSLSLNKLIEQSVLSHFELNHTKKGQSLCFDIHLPNNDVMIIANQNLLEILINNLISNVIAHATSPEIILSLDNHTLTLVNQYNNPLPTGYQASGVKREGSIGIGQGLSLIKRICEACCWHMSTHYSEAQQQFTVTIDFVDMSPQRV